MKELTDADRKLLTEYLGECWHEDDLYGKGYPCRFCGKEPWHNRHFTGWPDYGPIISRIKERGEWLEFFRFAQRKFSELHGFRLAKNDTVTAWLFSPARLEDTVAPWIRSLKI